MATENLAQAAIEATDLEAELVRNAIRGFEQDIRSRAEWEEKRADWYKLARSIPLRRVLPFPGAANTCIPIMASACLQFGARGYASLFQQDYPRRATMLAVDPTDLMRARKVERFFNYQLIVEMEEYEDEWDLLLNAIPINGHAFTKTTWFETDEWGTKSARPRVDYISPLDLVVPYGTRRLGEARRITHRQYQHLDEIKDLGRDEFYFDTDRCKSGGSFADETENPQQTEAEIADGLAAQEEDDIPNTVLEQHVDLMLPRLGDRDADERPVPYKMWVDKENGKLLRLVDRRIQLSSKQDDERGIIVLNEFTDYPFIRNTAGFYGLGFGHYLEMPNRIGNAVFNAYIDAARFANQPPVFYGARAGLMGRFPPLSPGARISVADAQQAQVQRFAPPGQELFMLLGLIKEYGSDISSNSDELQGRSPRGVREPTVRGTMARIEQGLVTYGVIIKRIIRQQRMEFRKILDLDRLFVEKKTVYRVLGTTDFDAFDDIADEDFRFTGRVDVVPTADPMFASPQQRRAEAAEAMGVLAASPVVTGNPQLGIPPNLNLMNAALGEFLRTYDMSTLIQHLPEPAEPSLDPAVENELAREGRAISAKADEDHTRHGMVHDDFMASEDFAKMDEKGQLILLRHRQDHVRRLAMEMQARQQQQVMAAAQAQGGAPMAGNPTPAFTPPVGAA